jgi:ectoine hydroxylase-related dioxygenase (phytanoyl-CoA dioxygenase family)
VDRDTTDHRSQAERRPLSDAELQRFGTEGFVVLRRVVAPGEVDALQRECARVWALPGLIAADSPFVRSRDTLSGGRVAERLEWITDHSAPIAALAQDPRLLDVAAGIFGEPANLFKDRYTLRPPGTCGYGMHQDHAYWAWTGIPADAVVTFALALDPHTALSGGIEVFAGYHRARLPGRQDEPRDVEEGSVDQTRAHVAALDPGDMLVLHSLAPHRSAPNRARHPRRLLFFIYTAARYGHCAERLKQRWQHGD